MRADNTRFLVQAARRRSQATRERAIQALRRLAATGDPVTFDTVARTAGVSRSWLYAQPDLRIEIGRLRAQQGRAPSSPPVPARQRASDASLRRRLEAVNAEIRRLAVGCWSRAWTPPAPLCSPRGLREAYAVMSDDMLVDLAKETLGLAVLAPTEDELALLPVLHTALGPGLAALDALDLARLPAEPDLDPGRAPATPVA